MEAVVALPECREVLERNPSNRHRFLDQDPREFIASLERWTAAYCPCGDELVPGAGHRRPQARHPDPRVPERCERCQSRARCRAARPAAPERPARRAALGRQRGERTLGGAPRGDRRGPVHPLAAPGPTLQDWGNDVLGDGQALAREGWRRPGPSQCRSAPVPTTEESTCRRAFCSSSLVPPTPAARTSTTSGTPTRTSPRAPSRVRRRPSLQGPRHGTGHGGSVGTHVRRDLRDRERRSRRADERARRAAADGRVRRSDVLQTDPPPVVTLYELIE